MSRKRIIVRIVFNASTTRPNWKNALTASWIRYRLSIFMKYTLRSLRKQTNQDFVALVQYSDLSEALIKQTLGKYGPLPENVQFVPTSMYEEKFKELITGFDELYLVRLDCDDMYHKSMIEQLMNYRPKSNTIALINQKGYIYDAVRNRFAAYKHPSPPFYTLIYRVEDYLNGKRHRIPGSHGKVIKLKHEILTRKGNRNYMIVVHKRNTLNQKLLQRHSFQRNPKGVKNILRNY